MAARRLAKHTINWTQLAERVPENQKSIFASFKSLSDNYARRVNELPETLPKIDWSFYKSRIPIPGLVDDFEKQYSAVKIDYPANTLIGQLDSLEKEIKSDVEKFKVESNARIEGYKKELAHLESLIPYEDMTLEEFKDAHPEIAVDPINKPSFWPHTEEAQPGYLEKNPSEVQNGH